MKGKWRCRGEECGQGREELMTGEGTRGEARGNEGT